MTMDLTFGLKSNTKQGFWARN